ncbi:MAG: ATP-grasp domain-containing protein, partial [Eubacteriales bacterium]
GGPAEIDRGSAEFYDYETKYISDQSSFYIPARISEELQRTAREHAVRIFKALDCKGFARVDFFCTDEGRLVFNEINTLPGFTPISMFPKMMIHEGISYPEVLDRLIKTVLR